MPLTSISFQCTHDPAEARTWFAALIERQPIPLSAVGRAQMRSTEL